MTPVIAMPASAAVTSGSATVDRAAALPDLPMLSGLLHAAKRLPDAADWRSGVLAALDIPESGRWSAAAIAARAVPTLQPGTAVCLALPVHVVAGMTRMFLGAPGSYELDARRREELRQAFNAEFGAADLHLHAVGSGWLLQASCAGAASDGSPESLLGAALAREPAASAAGRSLRRLGAEVEMWLAGLPFNAARQARGEPPINTIWFWSGTTTAAVPAPGRKPGGLFTGSEPDAWIAGMGSHCGLPLRQAGSWRDVRDIPGAIVILQRQIAGDVVQQLTEQESDWFGPVQRDLDAGHLPALRLQIGRSAWQLPASRLARWIRRRQPWWQKIPA